MTDPRTRLPAAERRKAVLVCACRVFSRASYRGATTAEIAREAGVTEPVLYRHFASKRDLYLTCVDAVWHEVRGVWERVVAEEPDPRNWLAAMGRSYLELPEERGAIIANLWLQALAEAADDAEIRAHMREHVREVHAFVAAVIRRSQEEGGVLPARDADAEAWVFIALGLLASVDRGLGGVVDEDFARIVAARRQWLTGASS